MKPIFLTEEMKTRLFEEFFGKFKSELENYGFSSSDTTLSVKTNFSKPATEKVVIIFSQDAYLKMQSLVEYFDTEVAWYGMVKHIDELTYYVYDVKVCKQYVNGAKVDTEDEDTLEFFNSLTDEEANDMHFQAHSHVKMGTTASATDMQNQQDVIKNLGKTGFYIFQIWNKNNDINTYLYDLDNNIFYDRKDVIIEIEGVDDFVLSVADLVTEKKVTTYPYVSYGKTQKNEKEKERSSDYWYNNYNNYGGYDW